MQYQAASHFFGHVYLTELLKDKLISSAPARLIWTTSASETLGTINWDNIECASSSCVYPAIHHRTFTFLSTLSDCPMRPL